MGRKKKEPTVIYHVRTPEEILRKARAKHPKLHAEIVQFITEKAAQ